METKFEEVTDGAGNLSKGEVEENPLCNNCEKIDYDKATLAERFCIKCEEKLCILCSQEHKVEEEHLVVTLIEQKEIKKFKESQFCINHAEELAELFCASCRKVICSKCLEESHSSHNCSTVTDVADLVSKQAEAEYESLFDLKSHFDKEREKLLNERVNVVKTVKELENEIRKRCDEITELVHSKANALLKELHVFKKERLEEIEMEMRKMKEHVFTFEKFKEYCDQIKNNTNPRYTCEAEGVLRNIVDALETRPEGRWKSRLFSVQFSIEKTDITQVLTSLGELTIKCPYKMKQSSAVKLDEKEVYGMAKLQDKLYVLSNSISIRRVQHPFASVGEIKTPEIKSPKDIISCPKTSCLYIHDRGADCIWKVSVSDHLVSCWLDKVKEPSSLSVTSNGELLMLRNKKPVCLEVYNEHAILLRRLKLPTTIPSLSSFDETPSGGYIGLGENCVFTFRRNGFVISQFQLSNRPNCQGSRHCLSLSPYHIFFYCGSNYVKDKNIGFTVAVFGSISCDPYTVHGGSTSSLTFDVACHQVLVDKSVRSRTPITSCYLKETKQLLVLEEVVSDKNKTWGISSYDVLPD